jgi:hypothetical protein
VRAVCGDKPHVQFGRGGLVLLSNQDLAFYLTSADGKAAHTVKGGRSFDSKRKKVREMRSAEVRRISGGQ